MNQTMGDWAEVGMPLQERALGQFRKRRKGIEMYSPFAKCQMTYSCSINLVKPTRLDKAKEFVQGDTSGNQ